MSIAFKPEEATDALKEYTGQIVATDYSEKPFDFKGAPEITRKGKVLGVQIRTAQYEKPQYEWYPPSKVKKTKWLFFIEALNQVGAMKDISTAGANDEERMTSISKSLLGMVFRWEERVEESLVKERGVGAGQKKFSVLLPVEYLGKKPIEKQPEVRSAEIGTAERPTGAID
jgi:hypothetical protein